MSTGGDSHCCPGSQFILEGTQGTQLLSTPGAPTGRGWQRGTDAWDAWKRRLRHALLTFMGLLGLGCENASLLQPDRHGLVLP